MGSDISRRSGWSTFFRGLGWLSLVVGIGGMVVMHIFVYQQGAHQQNRALLQQRRLEAMAQQGNLPDNIASLFPATNMQGFGVPSNVGYAGSFVILFWGVLLGIQFFFLAFLVDVLTDIRWFLNNLADKQSTENT